MSRCFGCGLEVNNGIIEVNVKPNGGMKCNPTDGLSVDFAQIINGGNGLQSNCGLVATEAAINLDIGDKATCGSVVLNELECVTGDGIRVDHEGSIVSNSLTCGHSSAFLETLTLPFAMGPGGFDFLHTPIFRIAPDCTDFGKTWAGVTEFDVGGLFVTVSAGGLARVSFDLSQQYVPNPIGFGGLNPSFRVTMDNRNSAGPREFDINLHDTTFQAVSGGQTLEFQLRLRIDSVLGTVTLNKFTEQQWEATWHYSHVVGDFDGCA